VSRPIIHQRRPRSFIAMSVSPISLFYLADGICFVCCSRSASSARH
jgi:hypothetical protein